MILKINISTGDQSWFLWLTLSLEQQWRTSRWLSAIQHSYPGDPRPSAILFAYLVMKRLIMYRIKHNDQTPRIFPALILSILGITDIWTSLFWLIGPLVLSLWSKKCKKQAIFLMFLLRWLHSLSLFHCPLQSILGWQWYNVCGHCQFTITKSKENGAVLGQGLEQVAWWVKMWAKQHVCGGHFGYGCLCWIF